jgi:hypothetical protein
MRSEGKTNPVRWLLGQMMQRAPGRVLEFIIDRSTRRIQRAAKAITLKDYS